MPRINQLIIVCIGVAAGLGFFFISSINLSAQGPYFDEMNAVPAAFFYIGITPQMFSVASIGRITVLIVGYAGALKSALYGIYLWTTHTTFDLTSWRLTGIILGMAGIVLFTVSAGRALGIMGLCVWSALFITDQTVLLSIRHDYGSVALLFLLRMTLLGLWLRGETRQEFSTRNSMILGILLGLGLYAQLSTVILIASVAIMFLYSRSLRTIRHSLACIAGVAAGVLPLVVVNVISYLQYGYSITLFSIREVFRRNNSHYALKDFFFRYLSLGNGKTIKSWLLELWSRFDRLEITLLGVTLLILIYIGILYARKERMLRIGLVMLVCYGVTGFLMYCLPMYNWVHYWLLGTPFQYTALAAGVSSLSSLSKDNSGGRFWRSLFLITIAVFILFRIINMFPFVSALRVGKASQVWDPSLTTLAQFAAQHRSEALFIATNWGVSVQIYCFAGGDSSMLFEVEEEQDSFYTLNDLRKKYPQRVWYVLTYRCAPLYEVGEKFLGDVQSSPFLQKMPVEGALASSRAITRQKYNVRDVSYEGEAKK